MYIHVDASKSRRLDESAMAWGDWVMVLIAAPFAVAGTNLGYHLLQRLTDVGFRKWTRWIVTVIGAYYLLRGLSLLAGMQ